MAELKECRSGKHEPEVSLSALFEKLGKESTLPLMTTYSYYCRYTSTACQNSIARNVPCCTMSLQPPSGL